MNLRDQLKEILPDILPLNPAESIGGTELIELVKGRLKGGYSDATLRYHFLIMSCDTSSPIAKAEQRQQYFLRSSTVPAPSSERKMAHPNNVISSKETNSVCFEGLSREEREGQAIETVIAAAPSPLFRFKLIDTGNREMITPDDRKRLRAGISAILNSAPGGGKTVVIEARDNLEPDYNPGLNRGSSKEARSLRNCPPRGNLRDKLVGILPDILPRDPAQAIKGTELIELVKHRLKQDYSDATLRYHFSIMSCDPSSPIAKVEQGQGYYLRTATIHTRESVRNLFHSGDGSVHGVSEKGLAIRCASKFRAVVQRYLESVRQFPFTFEESFSADAGANRWRIPDLAVVDWLTAETGGGASTMDKRKLEVHRRMGHPPLRITAVNLRLGLEFATVLEDLYQCLSASEWANGGELIVAAPIEDTRLAEEVSRFASRHGIGVISFGLPEFLLDEMPEPAVIENMTDREFESLLGHFLTIRRHAAPATGREHDWQHIVGNAALNSDFARLEAWISRCVLEERIITADEYNDLERPSRAAAIQEYVA